MLRWIAVLVVVLPLAGCESDEGFYDEAMSGLFGDTTAAPAPTAMAAAPESGDAHCQRVAYARAADAKANGFDDDMREQIYAGTYANCANWDRVHPGVRSN